MISWNRIFGVLQRLSQDICTRCIDDVTRGLSLVFRWVEREEGSRVMVSLQKMR